jgi:hypothetical protein
MALYLLPKTPVLVIALVSAIFLILVRPMWNFWWIEKTNVRRVIALMFWVVVCFLIGYASWPAPAPKIPTSAEIANELRRLAPPDPAPAMPDRKPAEKAPQPQDKKLEPPPQGGRPPREHLTIEKPIEGSTVSQNPPIEFTYINVPANQRLWLIVVGEEPGYSNPDLYWPIGHIPHMSGLSVIAPEEIVPGDPKPHKWNSEVPARNAWFSDAGKKYRLELIAVEPRSDRRMGREFEFNSLLKFSGVSKGKYDYYPDRKCWAKEIHVTRDATKQ